MFPLCEVRCGYLHEIESCQLLQTSTKVLQKETSPDDRKGSLLVEKGAFSLFLRPLCAVVPQEVVR